MAELQEKIYKAERERNQALEALDEANKVGILAIVLVMNYVGTTSLKTASSITM